MGYDTNALYLNSVMQDMPTGRYTRLQKEIELRPESAQLTGETAADWLALESERTGFSIRHQTNEREKRIDKLPVDGWCREPKKIAYQFLGCYSQGNPCTR